MLEHNLFNHYVARRSCTWAGHVFCLPFSRLVLLLVSVMLPLVSLQRKQSVHRISSRWVHDDRSYWTCRGTNRPTKDNLNACNNIIGLYPHSTLFCRSACDQHSKWIVFFFSRNFQRDDCAHNSRIQLAIVLVQWTIISNNNKLSHYMNSNRDSIETLSIGILAALSELLKMDFCLRSNRGDDFAGSTPAPGDAHTHIVKVKWIELI